MKYEYTHLLVWFADDGYDRVEEFKSDENKTMMEKAKELALTGIRVIIAEVDKVVEEEVVKQVNVTEQRMTDNPTWKL